MNALISSAEKATAKNGSDYYRVRFVSNDKQEHAAVCFDVDPMPFVGKVCLLKTAKSGTNSEKIEALEHLPKEDINNYIRTSKFDIEMMVSDIKTILGTESPKLLKIIDRILLGNEKRLERFKTWPAANTMHHSFKSGLLEHTWSMLKMAKALKGVDPALDGVDFGVVYAAIILHDVTKTVTYDFEPTAGADRNRFESLIGHISLADEFIVRAAIAEKVSSAEGDILALRHCVLSHHGKKEYGSPILPATREAIFVNNLDSMQARNQMAKEALVGVEEGMKSAYNRGLETELFNI